MNYVGTYVFNIPNFFLKNIKIRYNYLPTYVSDSTLAEKFIYTTSAIKDLFKI